MAVINDRWALNLPENRTEFWATHGEWEQERLTHMYSTTKRGDRVLYIGAEQGDMAALVASWGAQLFLVEPGPRVWANIKACWDLNDLPPPAGNYVGFCGKTNSPKHHDTPGWYDSWPPSAYGDVIEDHGFRHLLTGGPEIPVITVDAIAEEFPPDMITMDVEGAEWEVLQGSHATLTRHKPRVYLSLHPEFLFHDWDVYSRQPRDFIISHGYREEFLAWPHEAHFYYEPLEER